LIVVLTASPAHLFDLAKTCLDTSEPAQKIGLTGDVAATFVRGELATPDDAPSPQSIAAPGRPERPHLVSPRKLAQRGFGSIEGRAAFVHAIAHIEFNAINLAWDAVYRFRGMPAQFYADWVSVAADEARHFQLLSARLAELGSAYGDFDAHDGLWEMATQTADSCLARMALVPRVLEARGLDVTPGMIVRLRSVGDDATANILEIILREEVGHVAAGSHWFRWCCERDGLDPDAEFARLIALHARGSLRGPFNHEARIAAGFDAAELRMLESLTP
jgi:uncharacterized ferritin-like protein (DUF455 family)